MATYRQRACFTELPPSELARHSKLFGPFALEFEVGQLRLLGGMPVFYIPHSASREGKVSSVGASLLQHFADVCALLERLFEMERFARNAIAEGAETSPIFYGRGRISRDYALTLGGKTALIIPTAIIDRVRKNNPTFRELPADSQVRPIGCNAGGLQNILRLLVLGVASYDDLLANVRAMAGLFYPTERVGSDDQLGYYRQREWRLLGSMVHRGTPLMEHPSAREIESLLKIDEDFFGRPIGLAPAFAKVADECQFYRALDGHRFLSYVRRVICPKRAARDCRKILGGAGFSGITVVALETLSHRRRRGR